MILFIIAERSEKYLEAEKITEELRIRIKDAEKAKNLSHQDMVDITSEMSRQYKTMQDNYKLQISTLEEELQNVRELLANTQNELINAREETKQVIQQKDNEIKNLKEQMEDITSEFGDMLTETIRKIADRIEISPEGYTGEGNVANKMAEIATGTMTATK